jgi:hypothetical protein
MTPKVSLQALADLHLAPGHLFAAKYTGEVLSGSILELEATAPSQAQAVVFGNAVASAFLSVRDQELRFQTNVEVVSLTAQIDADKADNNTNQVGPLQSQMQQDLIDQTSVILGSYVLDPATAVVPSKYKATVEDALSGLVGGLGLGLGAVVVAAAISDRPRRREELADLLGAPIEVSLGRYRSPHWARRLRLRRRLRHPDQALRMAQRRLRAHVDASPDGSLAIVEVQATEPAALSTAVLALSLASEGSRVVLADMAHGRPLAALFGATGKRSRLEIPVGQGSITLAVAPDDPSELTVAGLANGADLVLALASADPSLGAEHIAGWASQAVVVLNAGKASSTRVNSTGQMLRVAGVNLRSAILFGAGAEDDTVGLVATDNSIDHPADDGSGGGAGEPIAVHPRSADWDASQGRSAALSGRDGERAPTPLSAHQ